MDTSPLLDIHNVDEVAFTQHQQPMAGYLDHVLTVFERHNHPFILVGSLALRWSGANAAPDNEIDVLLNASKMQAIADDLVSSGEWAFSTNPYISSYDFLDTHKNTTDIRDIWLVVRKDHISIPLEIKHLHLWPEDLYQLAVTGCRKIEIPDLLVIGPVLLEEEYYRDSHARFGPPRLSVLEAHSWTILQPPPLRSKLLRRDIPIFVPSIEDHLNALLDQRRKEILSGFQCGNGPKELIQCLIRCHVWDWPPASTWLLDNKVLQRNYQHMNFLLDTFKRRPTLRYDRRLSELCFHALPWELTPGPSISALQQEGPDS